MNMITFKKQFVLLMLLLFCGTVSHAADDLINQQITIKLDEAGTLSTKIGTNKKYKITNLKLVGKVNNEDWEFVREMAGGTNIFTEHTSGNLAVLDLSEVRLEVGKCGSYIGDDKLLKNAFQDCPSLKKITLPSILTSLGTNAFAFCDNLESIEQLPTAIDEIGYGTFHSCEKLEKLEIPSSVTSIGDKAFSDCSSLTNLCLPSGVTFIGNYAFRGCTGLTSLDIPLGITVVASGTFENCSGLLSLVLPSSVTKISFSAFEGCCNLVSLNIPFGVTEIGGSAFENCSSLTSLALPTGITTIEYNTFKGCCGLTSLCIPSGVTSIGDYAFYGCCGLLSLNIPPTVTSIGEQAIFGCNGLASLRIPSSVNTIGYRAFSDCCNLVSIYVSWETPLKFKRTSVFSETDKQKYTLYVPKGTYLDYWLSDDWGDFKNIVEYDVTGVDNVTTSTDVKEISRYSVKGQRLSAPTKGLNIVKYSDGSVKKVAVQ